MKDSNGNEKKVAYIVQELATGGALIDLLLDNGAMSEDQCKSMFRQIVLGVHHMHSQGICHKDLKVDNILLDDEQNAKIADFGFSKAIEGNLKDGLFRTNEGTCYYRAPEIVA